MGSGPQTNSCRFEIRNTPSALAVCPASTYELRLLAGRVGRGKKKHGKGYRRDSLKQEIRAVGSMYVRFCFLISVKLIKTIASMEFLKFTGVEDAAGMEAHAEVGSCLPFRSSSLAARAFTV